MCAPRLESNRRDKSPKQYPGAQESQESNNPCRSRRGTRPSVMDSKRSLLESACVKSPISQNAPLRNGATHHCRTLFTTGKVGFVPERLTQALRWRKPRRVFVNSMSDLFHEKMPLDFLDKVIGIIDLTPQHIYQILTKRDIAGTVFKVLGWVNWFRKAYITACCVSACREYGNR